MRIEKLANYEKRYENEYVVEAVTHSNDMSVERKFKYRCKTDIALKTFILEAIFIQNQFPYGRTPDLPTQKELLMNLKNFGWIDLMHEQTENLTSFDVHYYNDIGQRFKVILDYSAETSAIEKICEDCMGDTNNKELYRKNFVGKSTKYIAENLDE